jgi:hypothetical protein
VASDGDKKYIKRIVSIRKNEILVDDEKHLLVMIRDHSQTIEFQELLRNEIEDNMRTHMNKVKVQKTLEA